jgi:hypothetical protein
MVELTRHRNMTRHGSAGEVEECENGSGGHSFQPNGKSMEAGRPHSQRFVLNVMCRPLGS